MDTERKELNDEEMEEVNGGVRLSGSFSCPLGYPSESFCLSSGSGDGEDPESMKPCPYAGFVTDLRSGKRKKTVNCLYRETVMQL